MGKKDRVLLSVKRWKQKPSECGIAAMTSIAGYFDDSVKYSQLSELVPYRVKRYGLYTSQQARLLNCLNFSKVTIVTADPQLIDYSWAGLEKSDIIMKLRRLRAYYGRARDRVSKDYVDDMLKWLEDETCDNNIVIDYDFPKYIRRSLNHERPVGACFNWTAVFKTKKSLGENYDDIRGGIEQHAIVIRGYDDEGVFVVDSHTQNYTGRLRKYRNGYYKLSWTKFLVNMPEGDLILVG